VTIKGNTVLPYQCWKSSRFFSACLLLLYLSGHC